MARKSMEVSKYVHRNTGIAISIQYDRERHDHFAVVGQETVRADSHAAVIEEVKRLLDSGLGVTWVPVIMIRINGRTGSPSHDNCLNDRSTNLSFGYKRLLLAKRIGNGYLECGWRQSETSATGRGFDKYEGMAIPDNLKLKYAHPFAFDDIDLDALPSKIMGDMIDFNEPADTVFVAYTDATWATLERISAEIDLVREKLFTLASSKTGLLGVSLGQLEAPK